MIGIYASIDQASLPPVHLPDYIINSQFGSRLQPEQVSCAVRSFLNKGWRSSHENIRPNLRATTSEDYRFYKTVDNMTWIVTRVVTNATDPFLIGKGGGVSIDVMLYRINEAFPNQSLKICMPLAESSGYWLHYNWLHVEVTARTNQEKKIKAICYDPKWKVPYFFADFQTTKRYILMQYPSAEVISQNTYHQPTFNLFDCGRYVIAFIYLYLLQNFDPSVGDTQLVRNTIQRIFAHEYRLMITNR